MIRLHDISGKVFFLNCDLIYRIDAEYDTVITLTDQKKLIVSESPEEVIDNIVDYKRRIYIEMRNLEK